MEGGCCAAEIKAMPSATNNPKGTRALLVRREKGTFTKFMSKHRLFILPEGALLERINLLRCVRERITLPGGF
jgi:hypothetical protein